MEDVLDVYSQLYDPARPVICMDETSKQLVKETRNPFLVAPGQPKKVDYEYERNGVCNLFMFNEPLQGWRHVEVTDHRTKIDWAYAMKELADLYYKDADKIIIVLDNLNTHKPASFYEAFDPVEAKRLCERFEFHFTPKHGSWLNMAEIEFSVLACQCLGQRISTKKELIWEVKAWENDRNNNTRTINWQFRTEDARVKLKRLYPSNKP